MKTNQIAIIIVTLILIGGGAFYGGMQYAKTQRGGTFTRQAGAVGARGAGGFAGGPGAAGIRGANSGFVTGDIISKDDKSMTLKTRDGGSKIVFFSASTTVNKMAEGSMNDLADGATVMVNGSTNTDGSVTASMVQIRPAMPAMPPTDTQK